MNSTGIIMGVREHTPTFLQYLDKLNLTIGKKIQVTEVISYDQSVMLSVNGRQAVTISREVAKNILVTV